MERITITTKANKDYELLDSGREEKLERYGSVLLSRPDPQALWEKHLPEGEWQKATGRYERTDGDHRQGRGPAKGGGWHAKNLPQEWSIEFGGLTFLIKPTSFKHTGLFPEQLPNWEWMQARIQPGVKVLNLFGYTGGATLAAAKAGAEVVHVDASKTAVAWARENAKLSGLENAPIRWILEDALLFVKREVKRGNKYDGIVMDPPAFGHGPKNELWKIEEDFVELVKLCGELLSEKPLFFLANGYAAGYSPLAFAYNLEPLAAKFGGTMEYGDLTIEEQGSGRPAQTGRLLPCGIFARWSAL